MTSVRDTFDWSLTDPCRLPGDCKDLWLNFLETDGNLENLFDGINGLDGYNHL